MGQTEAGKPPPFWNGAVVSVEELERLMADLESDRVERKQSPEADRMRQAVCAFANDLPGHRAPGILFAGVTDMGQPAGLAITDQFLKTLSDMRTDGKILPMPSLTVRKVVLKGVPVAVVEVYPADAPPVRYKGQVWIRVGPRRAIATIEEDRRLMRIRGRCADCAVVQGTFLLC